LVESKIDPGKNILSSKLKNAWIEEVIRIKDLNILSLKKRHQIHDDILEKRFEIILPEIMKKTGIDCWLILSKEYNEDPVFKSLMPSKTLSAGRYSAILFFYDEKKNELEKFICARSNIDFSKYYELLKVDKEKNYLEVVCKKIKEKNPGRIALNYSRDIPLADGISRSEYERVEKILGDLKGRIVSSQELIILWMETRVSEEMNFYSDINYIAHSFISEVFSKNSIIPGYTKTEDLEYLLWEKTISKGLEVWFPPDVNLQRNGEENKFITGKILPGDLLHCDYGIKYLDLCTDTQRVAYVGENYQNRVPGFLDELMKLGNKVQDILAENIKVGLSGNQVLKSTLKECKNMDLKAKIYSHPIGLYGHGVGPVIGMFDNQKNVPVKGDFKINDDTCYAMELNASKKISEWGDKEYFIFLEQTVGITNNRVVYFDGRQEEIIFI
jgi:hypothetical protein